MKVRGFSYINGNGVLIGKAVTYLSDGFVKVAHPYLVSKDSADDRIMLVDFVVDEIANTKEVFTFPAGQFIEFTPSDQLLDLYHTMREREETEAPVPLNG